MTARLILNGCSHLSVSNKPSSPRAQRLQHAYTAQLEALSAAAADWPEGLRRERELFLQLQSSSQSQALRYQFFAEREAGKLPVAWQAEPRTVHTVAIIGAGTMGAGIAICALDAGLRVILLEQDDAALQRGQQRVTEHYQSRVQSGKMKATVAAAAESPPAPQHRLDAAGPGGSGDRGGVWKTWPSNKRCSKKIDAHRPPRCGAGHQHLVPGTWMPLPT